MKAFDFFPIAVTISDIEITPKEVEKLMSYYHDSDSWQINKGGNYVSGETYVFEALGPDSKFVSQIQQEIDRYVTQILGEQPNVFPTQSWLNFNPKNTSHTKHCHRNSIISGVFYLVANENTGNINFFNKQQENSMIVNKPETYNRYNYEYVYFTPKAGQLFLFPSWISHSVDKNTSDVDRISLAFNTFYKGSFGNSLALDEVKFSY
jgi:uncharacterized protein (TIGR02466 family)